MAPRELDTDAENGYNLDEQLRKQRAELRDLIWEEVDGICECCNAGPVHDVHEVFVLRSAVPRHLQHLIFVRENCAGVCRACHQGGPLPPVETEEFRERFRRRLRKLGYEPFSVAKFHEALEQWRRG